MNGLAFESVEVRYAGPHEERVALRGVTLTVHPGEFVVIYGARGSGKTTLLRAAAGEVELRAGTVRLGHRLASDHRKNVKWVGRDTPPGDDLPAALHVALPLVPRCGFRPAHRSALHALAAVNAADCANRCWSELSMNQRACVALAHALVQQPLVILVDDLTAGLAAVEQEHLVSLLRSLAEDDGLSVLMTTSDQSMLTAAHRVAFLRSGRVVSAHALGEGMTDATG